MALGLPAPAIESVGQFATEFHYGEMGFAAKTLQPVAFAPQAFVFGERGPERRLAIAFDAQTQFDCSGLFGEFRRDGRCPCGDQRLLDAAMGQDRTAARLDLGLAMDRPSRPPKARFRHFDGAFQPGLTDDRALQLAKIAINETVKIDHGEARKVRMPLTRLMEIASTSMGRARSTEPT